MVRFLAAALLLAGPAMAQSVQRRIFEQRRASAEVSEQTTFALPDPGMTPGAIDPTVTLDQICNGTTKARRPRTTATCDRVFAAYSIPTRDRYQYECDHDVPIALGGSSVAANLWPQPNVEAPLKDALEVEMQRRACVAYRTLLPTEAAAVLVEEQREIAADWPAAYRRYMRAGR